MVERISPKPLRGPSKTIDGIKNPGGDIDFVTDMGMIIVSDDDANKITFYSSGSASLLVHALNGPFHTGQLDDGQIPASITRDSELLVHTGDVAIHFVSGSIDHNDLSGLQGGQADEYYHLKNAEHSALVDGSSANGYHTHPKSGSADTLDSVCERGATTDQPITVESSGSVVKALRVQNDLQVGNDLEVNGDIVVSNPFEGDAFFGWATHNPSGSNHFKINVPDGKELMINYGTGGILSYFGGGTSIIFRAGPDNLVYGYHLGCGDRSDPTVVLTFFGAGPLDHDLVWHNANARFEFDNNLAVLGSASFIGDGTTAADKYIYANNGDVNLPGLRYSEANNRWEYSNDGVNWYQISSGAGNGGGTDTLDDVCGRGNETATIKLSSDLQCTTISPYSGDEHHFNGIKYYFNYDGPDADIYLYFRGTTGDIDKGIIRWRTGGEWIFNKAVNVQAELTCDKLVQDDGGFASDFYGDVKFRKDIYINSDYSDLDVIIYFGKTGSVYETLRWDKALSRFEFSNNLVVSGSIETTDDFYADTSNGKGVIVADKADGTLYRICVISGSVSAEAI